MAIAEQKLLDMGIELKVPGPCSHPILRCKQTGNLVFVSGHGEDVFGKLGAELTVQQGYEAARTACTNCLAALKGYLGDLDRVKSVVKVFGMVNSAPDFTEQPAVVNGASELLIAVFGEAGWHARSAVGMGALPRGIACEVEMIVEVV